MGWLQQTHLLKLLHRGWSRHPWYVILYVTNRCNMKCHMCFYWQELNTTRKEQELTLEELTAIARQLPHLYQLTLTGGEPLLRQDLAEIIRLFVQHTGLGRITVPSNGWFPERTAQLAATVAAAHPEVVFSFNLSLDGVGEVHDTIRATAHSFERVVETWRRLKEVQKDHPNLAVATASVVSWENLAHIPTLAAFIDQYLDPIAHGWMISRGSSRTAEGAAPPLAEFARLLQQQHQSLLDRGWRDGVASAYLASRLRTYAGGRMVDPCLAGKKLLVIQPDGLLLPCEMLPPQEFAFGNLREVNFDLNALLQSERGRAIRQHIAARKCDCTFECAMINNFVLNPASYSAIIWHGLRHRLSG